MNGPSPLHYGTHLCGEQTTASEASEVAGTPPALPCPAFTMLCMFLYDPPTHVRHHTVVQFARLMRRHTDMLYFLRGYNRVSVQGVKSLGGHFACLCRGFEFYEVKKKLLLFFKKSKIAQIYYSELSNKHAANLILFEKIFPPTCLIRTYTFIYF